MAKDKTVFATSVRLPDDIREAVDRWATDEERSQSSMIIRLLREALNARERTGAKGKR